MTTQAQENAEYEARLAEARETGRWSARWANIQLPQFSRLCETIWGGRVAVLPNTTVYAAAQRASRKGPAVLAMVRDSDGGTTYEVGGRRYTIDAETGETVKG